MSLKITLLELKSVGLSTMEPMNGKKILRVIKWVTVKNHRIVQKIVVLFTTGFFLETVKKYLLIAQVRKQPVNLERCPFVH